MKSNKCTKLPHFAGHSKQNSTLKKCVNFNDFNDYSSAI